MNVIDGKDGSATRMAYLTLRDMILTGELPAGKKLKIEDLRTLLATGASPVREALSLLTSDMLVERIDQRGFRAAPASIANFDEILSLRCALDDKALRQSIAAATSVWEERLVLSHHRMNRTAANDPASFEDAHKMFHMTLLDNSGSPMLERFCSQLYDLNIRYRNLAADGPDYKKRDIPAEHQAILDAVIRRKADEASAALLNHYRRTGEYLMGQLTNL
ncbi:GntR family transcriptional regulator [Pseudorhodobacter sp. W20_MBD10_FR17]|uniref:GntR family transcriptional regulator n=1 Tax=Pseudorhodobacter sp. W20_MBD10_FR17 TaxID=3240266 RepID=UPI003F998733